MFTKTAYLTNKITQNKGKGLNTFYFRNKNKVEKLKQFPFIVCIKVK